MIRLDVRGRPVFPYEISENSTNPYRRVYQIDDVSDARDRVLSNLDEIEAEQFERVMRRVWDLAVQQCEETWKRSG